MSSRHRPADRECVTCGRRFKSSTYRECYSCRASSQTCTACGAAFYGVGATCARCYKSDRQCVTCGKQFRSRYRECYACRTAEVIPLPCQVPGCGNPKVPGRGMKLCQEHRDDAYQRKLERLRKKECFIEGCAEPRLAGRRFCAQHGTESAKRGRAQLARRKRERKYGLTHDEFLVLLEAQGGVCAICGNSESSKNQRSLNVDHDHETGTIRGLLCNRCNPMLGYARDDIAVLQAAVAYLEKHQSQSL